MIKLEQVVYPHKNKESGDVILLSIESTDNVWVCLGKTTLTGLIEDMSDKEATMIQVQALKKKAVEVRVNAEIEVEHINEQIQSLMALDVSDE